MARILSLEPETRPATTCFTDQDVEVLDTGRAQGEEFAANVRQGRRPETGGPEALEDEAVREGLVESATAGEFVDLEEVRSRT